MLQDLARCHPASAVRAFAAWWSRIPIETYEGMLA